MAHNNWHPKEFRRFGSRVEGSSTQPSVITTDAGSAYVKCLGNKEGPHALACDWIGTRVADALGLPTFDFAVLPLRAEDVPFDGGREEVGPAFATRKERGDVWDGSAESLDLLANPEDVCKLVLLDSLVLNADRKNPTNHNHNFDNVFLSKERAKPKLTLLAIDHTHILRQSGGLRRTISQDEWIRFDRTCGLFPEFHRFIDPQSASVAMTALGNITDPFIRQVLGELPREWQVERDISEAVRTFLQARRDYLVDHFLPTLSLEVGRQLVVAEAQA